MKIMQINVVYKTGSTGKIVYELHSYLEKHNITSIVCYGRGNSVKEKNVYNTLYQMRKRFRVYWEQSGKEDTVYEKA